MIDTTLTSVIPDAPESLQVSHLLQEGTSPVPTLVGGESPARMDELVRALENVDQAFQHAFRVARHTRDREADLEEQVHRCELEAQYQRHEAELWRQRYDALERKIPWWARKLLGLQAPAY